jgi:hypothetical protein
MTQLWLTDHACERLAERFGMRVEDRAGIVARLMGVPAVAAALAMGGTGKVRIPGADMTLVLSEGSVVTVVCGRYGRFKGRASRSPGGSWGVRKPDTWRRVGDVAREIVDRIEREREDG